jgi:CBS domain-containing protein
MCGICRESGSDAGGSAEGATMRVFEVMTERVQTVPATMPALEAWELMRRKRIHHLVVTEGQDVLGVLSDRDGGGPADMGVQAGYTVADLMTSRVVTVGPNETIRAVANMMRGRTIGCMPVVDKDRLVGIVTVSDLLQVLGRGIDRPARPGRPIATHRVPHRRRRHAGGAW